MNDLDLRIALHRDADLVGEPSPDLLDQLALRRDKQRRQRAGMLAAAAAVAVIAAAVPVGSSLLKQSDSGPAVGITDPAPSTTHEVPTTPPVPTTSPVPTEVRPPVTSAPPAPESDAPTATLPVATGAATCPDQATLLAILDQDPGPKPNGRLFAGSQPVLCSASKEWAMPVFGLMVPDEETGGEREYFHARLFRFVEGAWTLDDWTCEPGDFSDEEWQLFCEGEI